MLLTLITSLVSWGKHCTRALRLYSGVVAAALKNRLRFLWDWSRVILSNTPIWVTEDQQTDHHLLHFSKCTLNKMTIPPDTPAQHDPPSTHQPLLPLTPPPNLRCSEEAIAIWSVCRKWSRYDIFRDVFKKWTKGQSCRNAQMCSGSLYCWTKEKRIEFHLICNFKLFIYLFCNGYFGLFFIFFAWFSATFTQKHEQNTKVT